MNMAAKTRPKAIAKTSRRLTEKKGHLIRLNSRLRDDRHYLRTSSIDSLAVAPAVVPPAMSTCGRSTGIAARPWRP